MPQDYNPKPEVDEKYPFFAPFWRHLTDSVYSTLFVSDLEIVKGKSSKMAGLLPEAQHPSPLMLHLGVQLLKKAYADSWLECHISAATGELEGLPDPEDWQPEALEDIDTLVRPSIPLGFIKNFIDEMAPECSESALRRYETGDKDHLVQLIKSYAWLSDYAHFANEHYGKVTPVLNREMPKHLSNFLLAMEDLGCF